MCLIIDANTTHEFTQPTTGPARPIVQWLLGQGFMVYGGRLRREYDKASSVFRRFAAQLLRSGRVIALSDESIDDRQRRIVATGLCRSDDPHIIAIAIESGARVLFSYDKALHKDFKNPKLLEGEPGTVYLTARHARLLKHSSHCVGRPQRR